VPAAIASQAPASGTTSALPTSTPPPSTPTGGLPPSAPATARVLNAWSAPGLGYRVQRGAVAGERIDASDDGRIVAFVQPFSAGSPGGNITVLVGTPALGVPLPTAFVTPHLFAPDINGFASQFSAMTGAQLTALGPAFVGGGQHGIRYDGSLENGFGDFTMFVTVQDGRDYVIVASGFVAGSAPANREARHAAINDFLPRFRLDDIPLYRSQALQFEAPCLTGKLPAEAFAFNSAFWGGTVTFPGRAADTWIRVDVGTQRAPAYPQVLAGRGPRPPGLWAADFDTLVAQFVTGYGGSAASSRSTLDGRPSLVVEGLGETGIVIVSQFEERSYVITTGPGLRVSSQYLLDFLRDFHFGPA
jgi:hypothetical protein